MGSLIRMSMCFYNQRKNTNIMTTLTHEQCLNAVETGEVIPTAAFIQTHNITYNDCLCASLGMLLPESINACFDILRLINKTDLDSFSQTFLIHSDGLLYFVNRKWYINSNHVVWVDTGIDAEIDTEGITYQGPVVE